MDLGTALRRLGRAEARVAALEQMIEERSRELFLASEGLRSAQGRAEELAAAEDGLTQTVQELRRELVARQRSEWRLRFLSEVRGLLALAQGPAELQHRLLELLGRELGWDLGVCWVRDPAVDLLVPRESWSRPGSAAAAFLAATTRFRFAPGLGLPGRAWLSRAPAWIEDLACDANFPRAEPARAAGLSSGVAFPVDAGDSGLWVLELFSERHHVPAEEELELMAFLGAQLALVLGRLDAIRALEESNAELRRARDEALAAARAKADFLAMMSHELRTPMNGVLGVLQLLAESPLDADQSKLVLTAHASARALLTVVNDVLDYSKLDAGRLDLTRSSVSLGDLLAEILALFAPEAARKGITLEAHLERELPDRLESDPDRLRQILVNLVGNAVKFTTAGGVWVRALPSGNRLVVEVEDSGIGIAESVLPRLFTPFTQADATLTRRFGGTGLGLAISRRLARMLGGDIQAHSVEGEGARFRLELPLVAASATRPDGAARDGRRSFAGARVLVAEDNEVNQLVIERLLRRLGCVPELVPDGERAASCALEGRHQLVLMDCQMPKLDGFQATRLIRRGEERGGGRVPIVALTAHALEEDRRRCLDAGMDDYLAKPIDAGDLARVLGRWLPPGPSASD